MLCLSPHSRQHSAPHVPVSSRVAGLSVSSCSHIPLFLCHCVPCLPVPLFISCSCVLLFLCPHIRLSSCPLVLMFLSAYLPIPRSCVPITLPHPTYPHAPESLCSHFPLLMSHIPLCPRGPHSLVLASLRPPIHMIPSPHTSTLLSPTSQHPHVLHPHVPWVPASPRPIPAADAEDGASGRAGRGGGMAGRGRSRTRMRGVGVASWGRGLR